MKILRIATMLVVVSAAASAADISPNYRIPGSLTTDNFRPTVMLCPSSDGSNTMVDCATKSAPPTADQTATGQPLSLTTLNAAVSVVVNGRATMAWVYTGLTGSGATLVPEASDDGGANWATINCVVPASNALVTTLTANGQCRVNAAARTNLRLRVSVPGTGAASISYNASTATGLVGLSAWLPDTFPGDFAGIRANTGRVPAPGPAPRATATPVTLATDQPAISTTDPANSAFQGVIAITPGTVVAATRSIGFICTNAGNITLTLANGSTMTLPIAAAASLQTLPLAVTNITLGTGTAGTFWGLI